MTEKQLTLLESKLELLRDYRARCPKRKVPLVLRLIESLEARISRYYARLSRIT